MREVAHPQRGHTVQRRPALAAAVPGRGAALAAMQGRFGNAAVTRMVQRHASWEHKALGDIDPKDLELIASGRDAKASKDKTVKIPTTGETIGRQTILHTLDQEIRRVKVFQHDAPADASAASVAKLAALDRAGALKEAKGISDAGEREKAVKEAGATTWDVRLVAIPLSDGSKAVVTYGEMNTLADIYGNPEEMGKVPADNFRRIVQGIREESLRKLMRLYNEIAGTHGGRGRGEFYEPSTHKYAPDSGSHDFAGAIGNEGTGDTIGELGLMGKFGMTGKAGVKGDPSTGYQQGLARNACHFAPQSWHSWGTYHEQAVAKAKEAHALRQQGRTADADSKESEALIDNGFGDHFLQDSFAAGHLVNKTLIMQWFVKWLDAHPTKSDMTLDQNWRKAQNIAYNQPGLAGRPLYSLPVGPTRATDPQAAENTAGGWEDRFRASGLRIPSWVTDPASAEMKVFSWWQLQASKLGSNAHLLEYDIVDLAKRSPVKDEKVLERVLTRLHDDMVIRYASYGTADRRRGVGKIGVTNFLGAAKNFALREEFVPAPGKAKKAQGSIGAAAAGSTAAYAKQFKATTAKDHSAFLDNSYIQWGAGSLHDDFCKNGLTVRPTSGSGSFKVYGDNAMLQTGSAEGVRWSAETSRMSRDSVYDTIRTGSPKKSTSDIAERLPTRVVSNKSGKEMSLERWHAEGGDLWKYCNETAFPDAAAFFSKSTITGLADMGGSMTKDAAAHDGEAF